MVLESIGDARKHVSEKRKATGENFGPLQSPIQVEPEVYAYIFKLQESIESEGQMDYYRYAQRMWRELAQSKPSVGNAYKYFESAMIQRLHDIDMGNHMYPEVQKSFGGLIGQYGEQVKNILLWSNGDVGATGYQSAKISRSRIVESFYKNLRKEIGTEKGKKLMREKTSYVVDDNKLSRIVEYVAKQKLARPTETPKLVIIEDSRKSFGRVRKALTDRFGQEGKELEIIPVWATYSREGQQAEAKARKEGKVDEFEKEKGSLNSISSFSDLLDAKRFGPIFKDAHVLLDFDGVVGNNITMRDEQAQVIFGSLVEGFSKDKDISVAEAVVQLTQKVQTLGNVSVL